MDILKIALDWTANTNHTGFFVANQQGFYRELELEVQLLTPELDNYAITPAKKVELGQADFALCPFESIVSYRTKKTAFDAVAIATIFQEDLSAIVTLGDGDAKRPRDLDGTTYASYQARYEDEIVRQMIKNDGGKGEFEIVCPKKLGIWETILNQKFDATWIFTNWEGIHAANKGLQLNQFKMADFGIPYGYSPVIMASERAVNNQRTIYADFLKATKKGFLFAQRYPLEAVKCIAPFVAHQDKEIDLEQSQNFTNPFYGDAQNWGVMENERVQVYLNWLYEHGLEPQKLRAEQLVYSGLL